MLVKLLINPLTKSSPRSIHFIFQIFLIVCCQPIHMLLIFEKKNNVQLISALKLANLLGIDDLVQPVITNLNGACDVTYL